MSRRCARGSASSASSPSTSRRGEDNPHRIFETMNACGRDLTCADMVGNFILMPLDRDRQERLYTDHLYPIECGFERHGGEDHFEAFIRHYLTLRTGEVPKRGEEYAVFRTHARSRRVQDAGPETLAGDLRTCADHYRAIVLGKEPDPEVAQAFRELAGLGHETGLALSPPPLRRLCGRASVSGMTLSP